MEGQLIDRLEDIYGEVRNLQLSSSEAGNYELSVRLDEASMDLREALKYLYEVDLIQRKD